MDFYVFYVLGLLCRCFCILEDIGRDFSIWDNGGFLKYDYFYFIYFLVSVFFIDEKVKVE